MSKKKPRTDEHSEISEISDISVKGLRIILESSIPLTEEQHQDILYIVHECIRFKVSTNTMRVRIMAKTRIYRNIRIIKVDPDVIKVVI